MGGRDFDNRLVDYFKDQIKKKYNIDMTKKPKALMKLRNKCEFIKRQLSNAHEVLFEFDLGEEEYEESITRAKFENLCEDLFKECMDTMDQVIQLAKMKAHEINEIILVGGSTFIPKIQQLVQEYFGGKQLNHELSKEEAVAYGATI